MSLFKKISVFTMLCFMLVLFLAPSNAYAATVGQALTSPEDGWQRFDDMYPMITYEGSGWQHNNSVIAGRYNNACSGTNTSGEKIKIKFYGTKIRVISENFPGHANMGISVDGGAVEIASLSTYNGRLCQYLSFEKLGLSLGVHTLTITNMGVNGAGIILDAIDIDNTGYLLPPYQPTNLEATPGNEKVTLKWDKIADASGYVIHYGTVSGNLTETKTVTGGAVITTDIEGLLNGTKYYFTVTAIINGVKNTPSIEVTATPTDDSVPTDHIGNTATLELTMTNGGIKVYNLPITDLDNFLTWYDNRSNGEGRAYYTFTKTTSIAPYLSVKEYVSFDKISSFEVKEYNQ